MDRKVEEITTLFPGLRNDNGFLLTSPKDAEYNCLAWATRRKDVWMWPINPDDDDFFWPKDIEKSIVPATFIKAFESLGFEMTYNTLPEDGYVKIALYQKDGEATHAARQLPNGIWTSKLGWWEDIQHSTPQTLEGNFYGTVFCYMKKKI